MGFADSLSASCTYQYRQERSRIPSPGKTNPEHPSSHIGAHSLLQISVEGIRTQNKEW